ncbi:MAG: 6-phosphogluconolactonase [Candidatus Limivicinus sp.]|jgi:6-phosphogluconolactonase/glucosamine-6-phosphate isomerase/deaminase
MRRFSDDGELGQYTADIIEALVKAKPEAKICIAAGTSSFPVFDALAARVKSGRLSFKKASFFGMDEWCGLPMDADGAMADFLRRHFLNAVDFGYTFLFDGMAEPEAECARAEEFFRRRGALDIIVFGIGVNGHVALNEPGVSPDERTHVAAVSPVTANVAQKYFSGKAPKLTKGISIGLANAAEAGKILLVANTPAKRHAVEEILKLLAAGQSSREYPASIAAAMPGAELLVTDAVFE